MDKAFLKRRLMKMPSFLFVGTLPQHLEKLDLCNLHCTLESSRIKAELMAICDIARY